MAALGYEFYLLVLKISLTSERSDSKMWKVLYGRTEIRILSSRSRTESMSHSKVRFVSQRGHVISFVSKLRA